MRGDQFIIVALVQADARLVQHVQHAGQRAADLGGQADALALAARQGCRAAGTGSDSPNLRSAKIPDVRAISLKIGAPIISSLALTLAFSMNFSSSVTLLSQKFGNVDAADRDGQAGAALSGGHGRQGTPRWT